MTAKQQSKVGSKGELFPPAKLRSELGLKPGQKIFYYIQNGRLIVEPIPDLAELLQNKKTKIAVSLEELQEDRHQLSRSVER